MCVVCGIYPDAFHLDKIFPQTLQLLVSSHCLHGFVCWSQKPFSQTPRNSLSVVGGGTTAFVLGDRETRVSRGSSVISSFGICSQEMESAQPCCLSAVALLLRQEGQHIC